tara:strand:- start:37015 stop:37350 length:336 start_codon:yes stop_codon:yes gene_type:complete
VRVEADAKVSTYILRRLGDSSGVRFVQEVCAWSLSEPQVVMTGLKSLLSDDLLQERREREPIVMFMDECSLFKKVQCIAEALLGPALALPLNPKLSEFFLERIEWERCKEE